MTTRLLLAALTAGLLIGCNKLKKDTKNTANNSGASVSVGTLAMCPAGTPHDAVVVEDAEISGDILTAQLGFGGGCEPHDLGLCWDGSVAESSPAQVWLTIAHDAHGDSCEAWLTETLAVDISALQVDASPLTVHLEGFSESLTYTW
jgi:hypothetical protein